MKPPQEFGENQELLATVRHIVTVTEKVGTYVKCSELCGAILDIFENDYTSAKARQVVSKMCIELGVQSLSVAIFEPQKEVYRVILGDLLPLLTKIPLSDVQAALSGVSFGGSETTMGIPKLQFDGKNVWSTPLFYSPEGDYRSDPTPRTDRPVGLLLLSEVPQSSKMGVLAQLRDELAYILWIVPRYEHANNYLQKYRSLWVLTRIFEESRTTEELLKKFLEAMMDILDAEFAAHVVTSDDFLNVLLVTETDEFKNRTFHIDALPENVLRYFRGFDKTLYKPENLELIFDAGDRQSPIGSALVTQAEDGWFVFANKKARRNYSLTRSFDSLDFEIARDSTRRYTLAKGRIEFEMRLRDEIHKLKELRKNYEALIENQREQIKKMNAVHHISQAMRTMYSVKNVYKVLLLGLTSGRLLGYNRALLLTYDEKKDVLVGRMWLGPEGDNVEEEWRKANLRAMRYADVVQYLREEAMNLELTNSLTATIDNKIFPYKSHPILERCVLRRRIFIANEKVLEAMGLGVADLVNLIGSKDFAVIPLAGREGVFGVVIVDNFYTKKPIPESDSDFLKLISDSAGLAIEMAISYEELRNKTMSLERQKSTIEFLREFSESVLQNMSSAIIVLDRECRITEWNRKAEVYFGRTKEQVTTLELKSLSHEFEDIQELAIQSMKIKEEISLSNYLIQIMGRERYYDLKVTPFWDSEKIMLRGVIITLDDVTERVNLEKERKKQEKLAALGEMAARVAHELRNPISVLGGFIKRLEKNQDNPETRARYVKIISDEILRLEGIVNEILDFSREPRSLEFTVFNVNKLIKDVFMLLEDKIREKRILFEFDTDSEELQVYGEQSRLKQVVINLVQNAAEATPVEGKIRVETRMRLDVVVITVWNSGTPIPKDVAEKLFTPFFTTKVHGTGLGLAICKKIVEDEHKGRIYHESTDDGNRFVVELPRPAEESGQYPSARVL